MRKIQGLFLSLLIIVSIFATSKYANAQFKFQDLKSEIKVTKAKGEKFLQRDLTNYVLDIKSNTKSNFKSDDVEMIMLSYLNRPHPSVATIDNYFKEAAHEFKVPYEILKAVAYVETNWTQIGPSVDNRYGIMALADDNGYCNSLGEAAELINSTSEELKNNAKQNIRGYAALLSKNAGGGKSSFTKYEDWFNALMITSGHINAEIQEMAVEEYYTYLKNGVSSNTLWNEKVILKPHNINIADKLVYKKERLSRKAPESKDVGDWYPGAIVNTTNNYSERSAAIDIWVNHWILGGTYSGAISWFKNPDNHISSAHFVIKHDGELTQMVSVAKKAWHATDFNSRGIGIEHAATIAHPDYWQDDRMLKKSTEVANYYCNLKGIPKVRKIQSTTSGIYGHTDMTTVTKNCPGPMPWDTWMMYLTGGIKLEAILCSNNNKGLTATWRADNDITSMNGFRLYYSENDDLTNWKLVADENTLTPSMRTYTINDPSSYMVPPTNEAYYFKMTVVNSSGVESDASDIYAKSSLPNGAGLPKVLIIDGFSRYVGSYTQTTHGFAATYFKSVRNVGNYVVSTCSHSAIINETIQLEDYDLVIWFTGDESTKDHPIDSYEQDQIEAFLKSGGNLFVTGSELGWALDYKGGTENTTYYNNDRAFYNNYLKADYVADGGSTGRTPAVGLTGDFSGVSLPFGVVYGENSPDEITNYGGSTKIMKYQNNKYSGVSYKGTFGSSSTNAALVHLSFALETVADQSALNTFFTKLMEFYGLNNGVPANPVADFTTPVTNIPSASSVIYKNKSTNATSYSWTFPGGTPSTSTDENPIVTYNSTGTYTATLTASIGGNSSTKQMTITVYDGLLQTFDIKHESRGVWLTTNWNLDWPSSNSLSVADQKAELNSILDIIDDANYNTVYLQVRSRGDLLYNSSIEPWASAISGLGNDPGYDPLEYAIQQAHARGLEIHAWFVVYRVNSNSTPPNTSPQHVILSHPEWIKDYDDSGTISKWLDPGIPAVNTYLLSIVNEMVTSYPTIDGVQFDYIRYPNSDFNDATTYTTYGSGWTNKDDWRRNNVNQFVYAAYDIIHDINPNIKVGSAPIGIYQSNTQFSGWNGYSDVMQDSRDWMSKNKQDYACPQIYWDLANNPKFNLVANDWTANSYGKQIITGIHAYQLGTAKKYDNNKEEHSWIEKYYYNNKNTNSWTPTEIRNQIVAARNVNAYGQNFYRTKNIVTNPQGILDVLKANEYKYPAIHSPMPWKDNVLPNSPQNLSSTKISDTEFNLSWNAPTTASDGDNARYYVVYISSNQVVDITNPANINKECFKITSTSKNITFATAPTQDLYVVVTALDDANNESAVSNTIKLDTSGTLSSTTIDDFEVDQGHFDKDPNYSGSTKGISAGSTVERTTTTPKNGVGALKLVLSDDGSSNDDWFVRLLSGTGNPANNLSLTNDGKIQFWLKSSMTQNNAQVFLWLDDSDGMEESNRITINNDGQYHLYEWSLTDNNIWTSFSGNGQIDGPNVTIDAIMFTSPDASPWTAIYIDDVFHVVQTVDTDAPTAPTNLVASNISQTSLDLSWTASTDNVAVTSYDVYKDGTLIGNTSSTSYSVSGLNAGTSFGFYVKAKDAEDNISNPSSTLNVTTLPNTVNYCTTKGNSVSDEWLNRVVIGTIDNTSGANGGYADFTTMSTDLELGGNKSFTLYPAWSGTVYQEGYAIWIDYNHDGDFEDEGEQVYSHDKTNASQIDGSFTVSANANIGTTRMRIAMQYNAIPPACGTYNYGETEDYNVNIITAGSDTEAPSAPTGLVASNITTTSLNLNWNASSDNVNVAGYYIYKDGLKIGTSSSTYYMVTNLTASTSYNFLVKAYDEAGNISAISNTINVTTSANSSYCTSKGNSVSDEWIGSFVCGSINNNSGANGGYADFTSLSTDLELGTNQNFTITPAWSGTIYSEAYAIWIDFNNDGDFDDNGEQVFSKAASTTTTINSSFNIPSSANIGTTRMRVSMQYNAIPSPCGDFPYGEVEDYSVNIITASSDTQAPTAPSNLTSSNITQTTVDLSWNASTDNVGVDKYYIYKDGSSIGYVTVTSAQVTGLLANTSYNFYVKATDVAGNYSSQSNTISITTLSNSVTYCASKGNNVSDEWIDRVECGSIDNTSGVDGGYADYTSMSTSMNINNSYNITIYPAWSNDVYNEGYSVWIDYNQDGDFEDAGEQVFTNAATSSTSVSGSFTVPSGANSGSTRMRVSMQYDNIPISCGNFNYGEVEDYTVVIGSKSYTSNKEINICPNPADEIITIKLKGMQENSLVKIYSITGSLVKELRISEINNKINISDLPNGVYQIKLFNKNDIKIGKFVKR